MNLAESRRFARNTRPTRVQDSEYFALDGGLNLVDASLEIQPGELLGCLNYEAKVRRGYESLRGYERFDGRPLPSAATYWIVPFFVNVGVVYAQNATENLLRLWLGDLGARDQIRLSTAGSGSGASYVAPVVGATLTSSGGGTAVILKVEDDDTLTTGVGRIIVGRLTGSWPDGAVVSTSGGFTGNLLPSIIFNTASTDEDEVEYRALAIDDYRTTILPVPGAGRILGVCVYNGVTYAFRNASDNLSARMYKATPSGWQQVNLGVKVRFRNAGLNGIAEGVTLTGATSGATGTVRRVVVTSGSFVSGSAQGYAILTGVTGAYTNGENLQVAAVTIAVSAAASAAQTLAPNGRYEFRVHNFYGHTRTLRMYGVDGVNRGFEYQDGAGEFFCQIETGMTVDAPIHLAVHQSQLWYAFTGGSVQKSSVNDPAVWSVLLGAAEIAIGDEPTGFLEEVGQVLFIFSRNRTAYIEGDPTGYALRTFNQEVGALRWSIQRIGQGTYLDDRGFATLATTDRFGNYAGNSISEKITTLVNEVKLLVSASCISKDYNRYRCFFSDGQFISITMRDRQPVAHMRCDYGQPVRCVWSGETLTGAEIIVFGTDSGYVYVADSGTSFDGEDIVTFMRLPFNHSRSPSRIKRYRRAEFDVLTEGQCAIRIGVDYTYARTDVAGDPARDLTLRAGGGFWDVNLWDQFRWNSGYQGRAAIKLEGSGENLSFLISSQSAVQPAHAVDGVRLSYSFRRMERTT
jgi:hypothetical protein